MPITINVSVITKEGFTVSSGLFVCFNISLNKLEAFVRVEYYRSQTDYGNGKSSLKMPSDYPETVATTLTPTNYQNDNILTQLENLVTNKLEIIVGASNTTIVNF